jgi:hypothetical protein
MTQLHERPVFTPTVSRAARVWEWALAIVGTVSTVLGAWIFARPEDGVLSIFGWEWQVADIYAAWPWTMVILGALAVIAAAMLLIPRRHR